MFGILKKMFKSKSERDFSKYSPTVDAINEEYEKLQGLSLDELRNKTHEFRARITDHLAGIDEDIRATREEAQQEEDIHRTEELFKEVDELLKERDNHLEEILKELLPEAFAVVKETARRFSNNPTMTVTATDHDRELAVNQSKDYVKIEGDKAIWKNSWTAAGGDVVWNMVHYDVQLIGGTVLHEGKIAEMQTGEGKTLVATLPAYLNGLSGEGVHVITVNDYLARRDCEWIGPVMEFLFLTIDCIDRHRPHSEARRRAYNCDITYGTNNEFGFDYLRDNMVRSLDDMVQRKHHYAMIDEVDSVLIDDARTPLIISGPVGNTGEEDEYKELKPDVEKLLQEQQKMSNRYLAEAKKLIAEGDDGFDEGEGGLALLRAHRSLPKSRPLIKFLGQEGVKVILQKAENFYMQENSKHMHIADEPLLFTIDEKNRQVELTDNGAEWLARGKGDPNFFVMPDIAERMVEIDNDEELDEQEKAEEKIKLAQDFAVKSRRLHAMSQLLKAYTLFEKNEEYIVINGEVKIVDEQTGRMMEGRRYSDGLHQALESKENVKVGEATQTYATVTLQNYFRMYHKLAGMTGTAETEAKEFWDIYKLDVSVIPTNMPVIRDDGEDEVYKTEREKFNALVEKINMLSKAGRPVLVGTTSVDISEKLSRYLRMRGVEHEVLNAKQHQREAAIVAVAGHQNSEGHGNVTIATNMAGRGTDIKLAPATLFTVIDVKKDSSAKGGYFYTIRQGGTGKETTLDESHEFWRAYQLKPEMYNLIKKSDRTVEENKKLQVGGLAIIGTERHDSRRVDRQLRGRAGRQGDPGSSQFYVSLDDKLMRLFQSERIAGLMDKMGHQEGDVIQHSMVTKSIERAQKKVEENNFGIRKRLLEYDDVMNIQREAIYKKRFNALSGERLQVDLDNMFRSMTESILTHHKMNNDYEGFRQDSISVLGLDPRIDADDFSAGNEAELVERYHQEFQEFYAQKEKAFINILLPTIKRVYENEGNRYKRIGIPFTDGRSKQLPISADLEESVKSEGKSIMRDIEKAVTLAIVDDKWKEHLRSMDEMKESVQSASFEQKDPLVKYKMEAYKLFEDLVYEINEEATSYLAKGMLAMPENQQVQKAREQKKVDYSKMSMSRPGASAPASQEEARARRAAEGVSQPARPATVRRVEKKVGRNDPCPCGSGKKFKKCHGK
ncbi:MAG TPA: preprotein translocase subunit SecA [Bacteroidetes bacterium]|nr:preprotein translocase subunit SecA [Bacteroidota bacterium]